MSIGSVLAEEKVAEDSVSLREMESTVDRGEMSTWYRLELGSQPRCQSAPVLPRRPPL